jgi:hypothetical protein
VYLHHSSSYSETEAFLKLHESKQIWETTSGRLAKSDMQGTMQNPDGRTLGPIERPLEPLFFLGHSTHARDAGSDVPKTVRRTPYMQISIGYLPTSTVLLRRKEA